MTTLEAKSHEILAIVAKVPVEDVKAAPGPILSIIIQVLTTLLGALGSCPTPAGKTKAQAITARISKPGELEVLSVRRTCRQMVRKGQMNPALSDPISQATVQVGTTCTEDDVNNMLSNA
jgi:hypothetical protein